MEKLDKKTENMLYGLLITLSNDNRTFGYCEKILERHKDENYDLLKTKMDNLVNKLNSIKDNKEELTRFINRDFEDDIWYEI